MPTSSSNLVVNEENNQRGQAKAFTDQSGEALGRLRAFGDVLANNSRLQQREAGLIGQIGGFKRGSSAVVPYELDAASGAGDGMKLLGDVLAGAGSVGTSAGLSGGSLFGLGAPKVPAIAGAVAPLAGKGVPRLNLFGGV